MDELKLEIKNISKGFGEIYNREDILEDFDLKVMSTELLVLVGPSGCGKSTFVNLIAGFDKVDSGSIIMDGKEINKPGNDRMVVFQETALIPWQTTIDNITFGPLIRGEDKSTIKKEAETLLEKVGLIEFKDKFPIQLSGGMQRRAELARAMINRPEVMIMDEPFRGLDAMSRELMQDFFVKLFEENRKTNIFVTSEIDEAIFLADRLVVLTNKPTKVRKIINIDLPRPRSFEMLRSEEAYGYKREAMELLHEEAMKSFTAKDDVGNEFMKAYSNN
ncbi:MAG: ABC transporter ATP-binding protein [bacterium]